MKKTGCFEKSAYKIQMPGNHPKERIQHSEHVEILKSRNISIFIRETINSLGVGIGCVQIIWMCSNYLDVFKLFGCVQIIWMCSNYLDVFKLFGCVQIIRMCSNYSDVFKLFGCVQIIWMCSNYLDVFKLFGCVQIICMNFFRFYSLASYHGAWSSNPVRSM